MLRESEPINETEKMAKSERRRKKSPALSVDSNSWAQKVIEMVMVMHFSIFIPPQLAHSISGNTSAARRLHIIISRK